MAELTFETLTFREQPNAVLVTFLKTFEFSIPRAQLEKISTFSTTGNTITFSDTNKPRVERKFQELLTQGFLHLTNKVTGKPTTYVHKHSGIPLISHIAFGIIDRDTSIIELRPLTGCNIACAYCSINEDLRPHDFVVEKDYLVEETIKIIDFKNVPVEIHLNSQGEPFLYHDMLGLISDLAKHPLVHSIAVDTNGMMLHPTYVDELAKAGLTRINLSLDAMDEELAKKIARNRGYPLKKILDIARYIPQQLDLQLVPVWVPGMNDEEIPKIIAFAKTLTGPHKVTLGIQNFLPYKFGRNPVKKQMEWTEFFSHLEQWEKEYHIKLKLNMEDFNITYTKKLPRTMNKGDIVTALIIGPGRLRNECIAVAKERCVSIPNFTQFNKKTVKVKITSNKHNLYIGQALV